MDIKINYTQEIVHIYKLTDCHDWLVFLRLTGEREYAPFMQFYSFGLQSLRAVASTGFELEITRKASVNLFFILLSACYIEQSEQTLIKFNRNETKSITLDFFLSIFLLLLGASEKM